MVNAKASIAITLAVLTACPESTQGQDQTRRENQDFATTLVNLGSGQTLVFRMMSPAGYGIGYPDFHVLETEVTNAQFKAFLDATNSVKDDADVLAIVKEREGRTTFSTGDIPYSIEDESTIWRERSYPDGLDHHPVALVTLHDATGFAEWLNKTHPDLGVFRLPTWNEWMITAYGKSRSYPWGNEWDRNRLHSSYGFKWTSRYDDGDSPKAPKQTEPVKARPEGRTPKGIFGILGNVSEYIVQGDSTGKSYFNLGSRWMGGGFTDGLAILDMDRDQMPPRNDYWGYSHHATGRTSDLGFRLVLVKGNNQQMLEHRRLFQQNNKAWLTDDSEDAKAK